LFCGMSKSSTKPSTAFALLPSQQFARRYESDWMRKRICRRFND